jgi:hypothetical protein
MVLVHARRFWRMSSNKLTDTSSSRPLSAQLFCHFLRTLLTSHCCNFSSGINHRLEYGDGLAVGVYESTAEQVREMSCATASSSSALVWMGGSCDI